MTDSWVPENASIEVDVNSLRDFAQHIGQELTDFFVKNVSDGIRPMLTVQAPFGGGGFKEGAFFRGVHDRDRRAAGQLLNDVAMGMQALSMAGAAIAAEYASGDDLSRATVDDVSNAFYPVDQSRTLRGQLEQTGTQPDITRDPDALTPSELRHYGISPGEYDPGSLNGPTNPDGTVTIDPGKQGQYTIGADDEHMRDHVPATPSVNP